MSLFGNKTTVYTGASIEDKMVVLKVKTRFNASHSETRVMIDKISSITHSVVFGKKSIICLMIGLMLAVVGVILMIIGSTAGSTPMTVGWISAILGILLILLAMFLRDHGILICSCGDINQTCLGRKNTDAFYEQLCNVLKAYQRSVMNNVQTANVGYSDKQKIWQASFHYL